MIEDLELSVTLWPSFPHFQRFARDGRLSAIRLNSAMVKGGALVGELEKAKAIPDSVPLYFDIKGRQLRVKEVIPNAQNLELILNHPISVETPVVVLFKEAKDPALLETVADGTHLTFRGGPHYAVYEGESLHIRHPSFQVLGSLFTEQEKEKIARAKEYGLTHFFLSYVESQRDIDEFREYVGDGEIVAKIENQRGLEYVAQEFTPKENLSLMAARGDLYVEIDKPHQIPRALRLIIEKDPTAWVGSRLLLSLVENSVPDCADILELSWLYDIGYKKMMLCDGLCLKEEPLARAVNVFDAFRRDYETPEEKPTRKFSLLNFLRI